MRKILLVYCSFVIACLFVIAVFITATTYTQLAIAILLYPVLVFFAYKTFPRRTRVEPTYPVIHSVDNTVADATVSIESAKLPEKVETASTDIEKKRIGIADIDKRVFLKLIGGAGLFLFIYSIFNNKTGSLFSKGQDSPGSVSLIYTTGNLINPAQNQPLDGYKISEIDDNFITYYGFIDKSGAWYVMKSDPDTGSFRYCKGEANFQGGWSNRESLKYDYYSNIFS